jgi:N-acetylneuraminic acid mutarotase
MDHSGGIYTGPGGDKLVIFGGRSLDTKFEYFKEVFADLWAYDFAAQSWTRLSAPGDTAPAPRFAHAATLDGDRLVVFGGITSYNGAPAMLADVWSFSMRRLEWTPVRMSVPLMRSFHSLNLAASSRVFAFAGYVHQETVAFVYNDLLVWDQKGRSWLKFVNGGTPDYRYNHRGVVWANDTLVYYGGSFRTVNDVVDMLALNTSRISASQLVRAPAEMQVTNKGPISSLTLDLRFLPQKEATPYS